MCRERIEKKANVEGQFRTEQAARKYLIPDVKVFYHRGPYASQKERLYSVHTFI